MKLYENKNREEMSPPCFQKKFVFITKSFFLCRKNFECVLKQIIIRLMKCKNSLTFSKTSIRIWGAFSLKKLKNILHFSLIETLFDTIIERDIYLIPLYRAYRVFACAYLKFFRDLYHHSMVFIPCYGFSYSFPYDP